MIGGSTTWPTSQSTGPGTDRPIPQTREASAPAAAIRSGNQPDTWSST